MSNPYQPPQSPNESKGIDNVPKGIAWQVIAAVGFSCLMVGWISRHIRPMIDGPIHYEAIASLVIDISLVLLLLLLFRNRQLRNGILNLNLGIAAIWLMHLIGWSIRHGGIWGDMTGLTILFWLGSSIVGSLAMLAIHRLRGRAASRAT